MNEGKLVPTVRTTFSVYDMTKAMIEAWQEIYGVLPQKKSICVMLGQWSIETGVGKYCFNNNIGNVKKLNGFDYFALDNVWEIINGKKVILPRTDPGSWFVSFPTLKDGVKHHMMFLKNKRYKMSWVAVENGDPVLFARLLKQQGYYTASEADYIRAVSGFYNQYMRSNDFEKIIEELSKPITTEMIPQPQSITSIQSPEAEHAVKNIEVGNFELSIWQKVQDKFYNLFKK